ncbi:MAG TPA: hypothetical protein VMI54_04215 [Polyangiaceae bacterium]|nr:hypothetical protein [Polyangiaceae bacterium]
MKGLLGMKSSVDTGRALADAQARFSSAQTALGGIIHDLEHGNRIQIKSAREREDDARAELNDARVAVAEAESAHRAAIKAEKLSRYAAARSGALEGRKLLDAEMPRLRKLHQQMAEMTLRLATILKNNEAQTQLANELGTELGEPADLKPMTDLGMHCVAIRALSGTDAGKVHHTASGSWLQGWPTHEDADLAIAMNANPVVPIPPGLTARESADLYLRDFDPSAALAESQRRQHANLAPVHAREAAAQAERQRIADLPTAQQRLDASREYRDRENQKLEQARARAEREREQTERGQPTISFGA